MEALTRLVSESLARHGFDRPLDYRRLHWSRWFRCESLHSLLFVPSKPGVFAVAEEIMDLPAHVATAASAVPRSEASGPSPAHVGTNVRPATLSEAKASAPGWTPEAERRSPEVGSPRRMLGVTQFFEDDDMAFVLDRMLSTQNPMRDRLASGRYFVRFVVIEDQSQRRSICAALNQWMVSSAEKATGIGAHFASSLELTPATEFVPQPDDRQQSLFPDTTNTHVARVETAASAVPRSEAGGSGRILAQSSPTAPQLDSGAATNIHCPSPLPSGF